MSHTSPQPAPRPDDLPRLRLASEVEVVGETEAMRQELAALRIEIENLRKRDHHVSARFNQLDEELRLAARLQRDFMPKKLPSIGPVSFQSTWRPASFVSGDLYDVTRVDEKHVGFYLADAVGHGVPAALLTMFVKHSMQMKEIGGVAGKGGYRVLTPGEALGRLNDKLVDQDLSSATFASAVAGLLNTDTLTLEFASAGHPAPIILRGGERPIIPTCEGGLLGVFAGQDFDVFRLQLEPGDKVLIYTDGVEVAFPGDSEQFDCDRWLVELAARAALPAGQMMAEFTDLIEMQEGSLTPRDDLTILVMTIDAQ